MHGIALRFWLLVSLLLTGLLLVGAGIEARLAYLDSLEAAERVQRAEARAAGERISQYLRAIEAQIRDAATLAWDSGVLSPADLQEEFHRVMKLVPAISEMRNVDPRGRERLFVSRTSKDRLESLSDVRASVLERTSLAPIMYGPVSFHEGARPFVSITIRESDRAPSGVTIAELDLKFVTDVVQGIAIGKTGNAYVVDRQGRLVAHPNLSLVLRETNLANLPHVAAAQQAVSESPGVRLPTRWSRGIDGRGVLVSAVHIPGPDWVLFAEEPEDEALAPVRTILFRTAALLAAGIVVAFVASKFLAGALTRPILRLREGAMRLAGGRLDARIDVKTGDEIESLARDFNRMAERLQESYSGLEGKVEARTRELALARDELERQAREVEGLNAQLTAKLGELELRKDEAERANAAKTRFLASASHDLRQPLHTIGLLVGILRDQTRNGESRDLAAKVEASVAVMQNLFSSLLDISKLDAGAIRPDIVDIPVSDLLQRIEANYAPQAAEKGLIFKVVPSRLVVRSDAILLERILGNLAANAVRYTREGKIIVGCRRHGERLQILVLDTGIGIANADLDVVFEEFVQLANPERDRTKGLGLGLSIVKRTADLLGHRLIVRSTPGRGSVFGIEIPRAANGGTATQPASAPSPAAGNLHGAFVIVIDDDRASRAATEALLRHWGCHVVVAGSPDEAVRALDAHLRVPDLIITDYRMQYQRTGIDAVVRIRRQAERAVPAIVVTGDVSTPVLETLRLEAVAVLHKPVDVDALRRTARALLDAHCA